MKRILSLFTALLVANISSAQVPVAGDNDAPVKLQDVVTQYMQQHGLKPKNISDSRHIEETGDYHFDRWLWYQKHNTDQSGYMMSPAKKFQEMMKYTQLRQNMKTTASQANWTFQGPDYSDGGYSGIGRINAIDFHPTDPNTFWVGTAGGGVWKTTDDGQTWTNETPDLTILGVSDIDVNPLNPNTIYLCTGDRDASDTYSMGVLKSTDGGATWDTTGLQWSASQLRLTNCLVINSLDTNSLTLAASNGIYKSYDAGATWTRYQTSGHFKQVLQHPTDTSILYATRYGNNNGGIYRSTDGGQNWSVVLSNSGKRRTTLAVTPQNPSIVKAVVANTASGLEGIYHSSNSGASFNKIYSASGSNCNGNLITGNLSGNGCGRQGWYDLAIALDPSDSDKVYVGGVNTWMSTDGGYNWSLANQWYFTPSGAHTVHADKHWLAFHPLKSGWLYECNDGGVYKTNNPGGVWSDLSDGLGITQFYRNAVSNLSDLVLAGAQDNGSKGLYQGTWYDLTGGDGMNCEVDYVDSNTFYTAIQYGELRRTSNGGVGFTDIQNNIPGTPSGAWITPYIISPHNHNHLIAGYSDIFFSPNKGTTWVRIAANVSDGSNAVRLAMTPDSSGTLYAVFPDTNVIFYTHNFVPGNTVTMDTIQVPYSGTISDIKVDYKQHDHFWITFSRFGSPQVAEYNAGVWSNNNNGLPDIPVYCFEQDTSNDVVYVGTGAGVFYIDTATNGQWEPYNNNLPSIEVTDLGINYTTGDIWASTYGRGMWKSVKQFYIPPPPDTTTSVATLSSEDRVVVAPNPNNGTFSIAYTGDDVDGSVQLKLVDYTGKVVWSTVTVISNAKQLEVKAGDVPSGIYILEVSNDKAIIGRTRVVVKE